MKFSGKRCLLQSWCYLGCGFVIAWIKISILLLTKPISDNHGVIPQLYGSHYTSLILIKSVLFLSSLSSWPFLFILTKMSMEITIYHHSNTLSQYIASKQHTIAYYPPVFALLICANIAFSYSNYHINRYQEPNLPLWYFKDLTEQII